ncbi:MAG: DUF4276 family protein [Pedobacter sp.]|nr:MAG: DUF4276 family protein [Pedobacter sp.]
MKAALVYALISEGFSEYSFIPEYLKRLAFQKNIQVKPGSVNLKGQPSKSTVLSKAEFLCLKALQDEEQALCIIGIDLDKPDHTDELREHTNECTKLINALASAYRRYEKQIIVYVPVQAIEHWLAYQAFRVNKGSKPEVRSLEKMNQKELKRLLYGDKDDQRKMTAVARSIAEAADFDELAKQSRSFNLFHQQVIQFMDNYASN